MDSLLKELRGQGVKITAPRLQVIDHVAGLEDNFTAEELASRLAPVGRATVYRTIRLLAEADLLCRVVMSDGSAAYRLSDKTHHHHLVCSDCGATEDIHLSDLEAMISGVKGATDYEIRGHRLEIYGLCPTCQIKAN